MIVDQERVEPEIDAPRDVRLGHTLASAGRRALRSSEAPILLALAAIVLVFSALRPEEFATATNAQNLVTDTSVLLILALATTYVIISAGIDISMGSVMTFAEVAAVKAMVLVGGDGRLTVLAGLLAAVAAGLGWGLINAILITRLRIPPLIATLATLGAALGAARLLSGGRDLSSVPVGLVNSVGVGSVLGVPALVVIAAVLTAVGAVILATTRFGRRTYAIGSNVEAARRAGVPVERHLSLVYGLAGGLYGVAAFLSIARFGTTSIAGHTDDMIDAVAAVAIGGASLVGGVGTVLGSVVGVFIPATLENGLVVVGLEPYWQQIAVGIALAAAVYLDQRRRRARQRS